MKSWRCSSGFVRGESLALLGWHSVQESLSGSQLWELPGLLTFTVSAGDQTEKYGMTAPHCNCFPFLSLQMQGPSEVFWVWHQLEISSLLSFRPGSSMCGCTSWLLQSSPYPEWHSWNPTGALGVLPLSEARLERLMLVPHSLSLQSRFSPPWPTGGGHPGEFPVKLSCFTPTPGTTPVAVLMYKIIFIYSWNQQNIAVCLCVHLHLCVCLCKQDKKI